MLTARFELAPFRTGALIIALTTWPSQVILMIFIMNQHLTVKKQQFIYQLNQMLTQNVQGQLQGPRLSTGLGQNIQMGLGMIQPNFGLQQQNSQQTFMPLSTQLPFPGVPQYQGQIPLQYQMAIQNINQGQLSQHQINYQQQPLVVQNLIQPQPQIQYQQQVVQPPPLQITQPAQIDRKVNYIPQIKQIVKMEEQEIEEIVPVERTIVEYIPVQTIIEKVPIPVEIPYEIMIPKPYQQEIKYPNPQNQFITDNRGNPLSNPDYLNQNRIPPIDPNSQQKFESEEEDEEQPDDEYDEQIEKYTRIIEDIKQRRRRRRNRLGLSPDDEDDFNIRKFQSKFGSPYEDLDGYNGGGYSGGGYKGGGYSGGGYSGGGYSGGGYSGGGYSGGGYSGGNSRYQNYKMDRGYHGRDKNANDYLRR
ncbi:unnamed protein product [Paramecium sonneborni]|uniref:Uncharacterized protein n=1 Tax=Paramecium sonneborni TaxID=65129 RepID=A0A8S1M1P8_9CILI|nr:unnamed protein product [Paramecium sonneborni]